MQPTQPGYAVEAELLGALAHPMRLGILELLRGGEACVCHIQAMLGQRQAYVSQHLMALRRAGWVTRRKEGLRVFYQVRDARLFAILDGVQAVAAARRRALGLPRLASAASKRKLCRCPQCTGALAEAAGAASAPPAGV